MFSKLKNQMTVMSVADTTAGTTYGSEELKAGFDDSFDTDDTEQEAVVYPTMYGPYPACIF